ncbi:hypothetical protein G9A89_001406 [Geosiphon pyriformis]|nr:hypothetical protein G9A89_001406 [Geosiphon pyriformis]
MVNSTSPEFYPISDASKNTALKIGYFSAATVTDGKDIYFFGGLTQQQSVNGEIFKFNPSSVKLDKRSALIVSNPSLNSTAQSSPPSSNAQLSSSSSTSSLNSINQSSQSSFSAPNDPNALPSSIAQTSSQSSTAQPSPPSSNASNAPNARVGLTVVKSLSSKEIFLFGGVSQKESPPIDGLIYKNTLSDNEFQDWKKGSEMTQCSNVDKKIIIYGGEDEQKNEKIEKALVVLHMEEKEWRWETISLPNQVGVETLIPFGHTATLIRHYMIVAFGATYKNGTRLLITQDDKQLIRIFNTADMTWVDSLSPEIENSNVLKIVGGVCGSLVGIIVISGIILYYKRKKQPQPHEILKPGNSTNLDYVLDPSRQHQS